MPFLKRNGFYESNRIVFIPVEDISPNPAQPRKHFEQGALAELAESIAQYGILQPLTVRRRGRCFELVAGERRLRASRLAGVKEVPCILMDVDKEESSLIAMVENLQRRDLDFIEEAEGISRLVQIYGLSQEEVARRVGKSQSAVANKLRILKLPPEILYVIREAKLSERHARALLRLEANDDKVSALGHIIRKGLNVSQTEEYIEYLLIEKEEPQKRSKPNYIIKDVRLFLNTISRGMDMMKQSGIKACSTKEETDTDIILTIQIPKVR